MSRPVWITRGVVLPVQVVVDDTEVCVITQVRSLSRLDVDEAFVVSVGKAHGRWVAIERCEASFGLTQWGPYFRCVRKVEVERDIWLRRKPRETAS